MHIYIPLDLWLNNLIIVSLYYFFYLTSNMEKIIVYKWIMICTGKKAFMNCFLGTEELAMEILDKINWIWLLGFSTVTIE